MCVLVLSLLFPAASPSPQHATVPFESITHAVSSPVASAVAVRFPGIGSVKAITPASLVLVRTRRSSPSWPRLFLPQQATEPFSYRAQWP